MKDAHETFVTLHLIQKDVDDISREEKIKVNTEELEHVLSELKESGKLENCILEMSIGKIRVSLDKDDSSISIFNDKEQNGFLQFKLDKMKKGTVNVAMQDSESEEYKSFSITEKKQ